MATPMPAPDPQLLRIGAPLITYLLPPPGGKGHELLLGLRGVLLRGCPAWEGRPWITDYSLLLPMGRTVILWDLERQPNLFPPLPLPSLDQPPVTLQSQPGRLSTPQQSPCAFLTMAPAGSSPLVHLDPCYSPLGLAQP